MTKYIALFLITFLLLSCHVTETLEINPDGSGIIKTDEVRDENFFLKINALQEIQNQNEEIFRDTIIVFRDYFKKYDYNFNKYTIADQKIFQKYSDVNLHILENSYNKEFRTTISQKFDKVQNIVDLYKSEDYADDIKFNYALSAEKHYYTINYSFENSVFKRIVKITDKEIAKERSESVNSQMLIFEKYRPIDIYTLNYSFPKAIKSVSNNVAKISEDKKSLILEFKLSDCVKNPEITNLEVVLVE